MCIFTLIQNNVTALLIASYSGHDEVVRVLLAAKATVNAQTKLGQSPLWAASCNGHLKCVELLINAGANVDIQDEDNVTALHAASSNGHDEVVRVLLAAKATVNTQSKSGHSPLWAASCNGHLKCVELLINAGVNVDIQEEDNVTALLIASYSGHDEVVRVLLAAKATVNTQNKLGQSPLWAASIDGHLKCVELLIDAGANVDMQEEDGTTALYVAAQNGHLRVVEVLIAAMAQVDIQQKDGGTALHVACQNGHCEVVECLVERAHCDTIVKSNDGTTPLHTACYGGHKDVVQYMVERAHCDISVTDARGRTPLDWAMQWGHTETIEYLQSLGAPSGAPSQSTDPPVGQQPQGLLNKLQSPAIQRSERISRTVNVINTLHKLMGITRKKAKQLFSRRSKEKKEYLKNKSDQILAEREGLPLGSYQDVILSPHLPTGGMSQPQESKHSFDLPGVEAVAHTHVIVTNSSQTFVWDGHGFKLHIPQDSLPAGVDQCQLDIMASVAGEYQFPDNLQLVSGVYWLRPHPPGSFQQLLTVEIQHCAKMTGSTKLSFVRALCSQESLPYTFKQLKRRGSFADQTSYGSLELSHFSGLAVTGEDVDREYTASLYYLGSELHSREIHFVVSWNDEIHRTRVSEEYSSKEAILGVDHIVEFEEDRITLDIPMTGAEVSGGWRITPMFHPTVTKKHVDQFKPGQRIPHCHLNAELTINDEMSPAKLLHQVKLVGAKFPYNIVTLNLVLQRSLSGAAATKCFILLEEEATIQERPLFKNGVY
ncbi:ankyrin-2-like isoform X2 [Halichondria panicea]|uniref:ankyrin-2-like isoform X2 n=1 Tax=Halichondria panicea TaxID=6063 RepID=UPI00312B7FCC